MKGYGFGAEDIARVRVETFHETVRLGTELPSTTEEAQFNLAWPLAAFIVGGEINFPQQTWDEPSLEEKFRWLTGYVLDEDRIDALIEMLRAFENVSDVRTLTELLTR